MPIERTRRGAAKGGKPVIALGGKRVEADACEPLVEAVRAGEVEMGALARGHYPGERLGRGLLPGLMTVGFWDAKGPQGWHLPWHRNEGLEVTYLERGSVPFEVEGGGRTVLEPGQVTVTRPWQAHRVGAGVAGAGGGVPACRLHWTILDLGVRRPHQGWRWPGWVLLPKGELDELTRLLRHCETPVRTGTPEWGRCFERVARAVGEKDGVRLGLHLNEMLVLLLELLRQSRARLRPELASSRRTVEQFMAELPGRVEESWTLGEMARACELGRTRFAGVFRELANTTPAAHLARLRVEKAKALLRETDESVTAIALRCGFSSSQYFATTFRRLTGTTPRAWRGRWIREERGERRGGSGGKAEWEGRGPT